MIIHSQILVLYDHLITFDVEVSLSTPLRLVVELMIHFTLNPHQIERIWT